MVVDTGQAIPYRFASRVEVTRLGPLFRANRQVSGGLGSPHEERG